VTYLYFIQRGCGSIKIGVSDDPQARLAQLQTGAEKQLRIIATFPMESREAAFAMEGDLHRKYDHLRMSGEWFKRRILREMKVGGKRLIGGTSKNPMVRTRDGWRMVAAPPPDLQQKFRLRDLATFTN
jgi:hypothetical protein